MKVDATQLWSWSKRKFPFSKWNLSKIFVVTRWLYEIICNKNEFFYSNEQRIKEETNKKNAVKCQNVSQFC